MPLESEAKNTDPINDLVPRLFLIFSKADDFNGCTFRGERFGS
jgi:hypothetical protein